MTINRWHGAAALCAFITWMTPAPAAAQVSEPVYQGLLKIGQIVDPACTAKLMREQMPTSDYNTWWAPDAAAPDAAKAKIYPGVAITRDQKFGAHDKDLVDIFTAERPGSGKTV